MTSEKKKQRIAVICPGRGSYTKETLGYLNQFGYHVRDFVSDIDTRRAQLGEPTITTLDADPVFKTGLHTKGEHASALIYACAYADFMAIDRDRFEIVAVTGNSMGWYLALAFGGALDWHGGFEVINTMGSMMKDEVIGAQVIYPVCDENWVISPERQAIVDQALARVRAKPDCQAFVSIYLGGYVVIGANKAGAAQLLKELPQVENYPFQLINHAAFHTPLLAGTSERAFALLPESLFTRPSHTLIDGRGQVWQPYSTDIEQLHRYTFGHQVTETYDFTRAISVTLKEFAPDKLVLLGPGASLGGSIGQIMIANDWRIKTKTEFTALQEKDPFLIAMGRPEQRSLVTK